MSGVWVHRVAACGGPAEVVRKAKAITADRVIVKARDGRGAYNAEHLEELADRCEEAGLPLWLWSWNYSTASSGDHDYCREQGEAIAEDVVETGASGVLLNLEAPFSWSKFHRWGALHESEYGGKTARKNAMHQRAKDLIRSVRSGIEDHVTLGISTFPIPSQHALPFQVFASEADIICPQVYFSGMGYKAKISKSIAQWQAMGAYSLRFSGPGWRGATKMRSMGNTVRVLQCSASPVDWWVLDRMEDRELDAASVFSKEAARCQMGS